MNRIRKILACGKADSPSTRGRCRINRLIDCRGVNRLPIAACSESGYVEDALSASGCIRWIAGGRFTCEAIRPKQPRRARNLTQSREKSTPCCKVIKHECSRLDRSFVSQNSHGCAPASCEPHH